MTDYHRRRVEHAAKNSALIAKIGDDAQSVTDAEIDAAVTDVPIADVADEILLEMYWRGWPDAAAEWDRRRYGDESTGRSD
jgi:hypothetical protein